MVVRCYEFLDEDLSRRIDNPQREEFLRHPSSQFEEWQVRQDAWHWLEEEAIRRLRFKHCSLRTEKAYLGWIRRFGEFLGYKAPEGLKGEDLQDFLTHLALKRKVAPSTQNQALNAIVFLFKEVLHKEVGPSL